MSEKLKAALREVKEMAKRDGSPLIYLHDPDDMQPFALLVRPDHFAVAEKVMQAMGWDPYDHGHIEGNEDGL